MKFDCMQRMHVAGSLILSPSGYTCVSLNARSMPTLNNPILSVIIVAYKSRDEIDGCLRSLPREIQRRAVEIFVIDNFPSDGTSKYVRAEYPEVRSIEPETNLGFGRGNNLGYSFSRGDFVLFLNPDTIC